MWHTAWNINDQEKYITFEFNDIVKLTKIKYVRRAYDEDNGTFLNYTVYTNNTEEGEWKASATGAWTWSNPNREQIIEFETPIEAKYVKIQANKTVKDNNFASASEIEFYENIATRPEITSQPQGGYSDSSITLNVEASSNGSFLNYQWYENNENSLFGATEIAGATDSSYVVNLAEGQKKYYFVKVTNAETCVSIISDIVMAGHGTDAAMVNGTAYSDLASAIKAATSGSVVYVLRDQEISSTIPVNKNITIEAEAGTTVVLKRSESFTGDFMFKVQSGANFNVSRTASGKVIIDGGNIVSAYGAVKVENGRFYLNSNGVIRNNNSTSNGAAVYTSAGGSSQIHIYGTITGNRTNGDGGAIYSNGFTYVYASSEISNNHAEYNAGAIYNYSGGVASISGGNHFGNTAVGNGGAVYKRTDNGTGRIDADFTKVTFENNKSVVTGEDGGTLSNVYVTRSTNLGTIIANATNDKEFYNSIYFEHTFVVTLNTGIDGETIAKSVRFMGQYDLPELQRNGYKFLGWFDAAEGGNKVEYGSCVVTKSNHNLYAHWERTATDTITITEQPTGGVMYKEDKNVLSVTAEIASDNDGIIIDEILNYQWYEINSSTNKAEKIEGATSSSITLDTNDRELGIYNFFCIVSGGNAADVKSETARVELISKDVAATPTFNTQPNNVDCFVGDDAVFTANATTVDLGTVTYQWYRSTDNVVSPETDEAIAGATEESYCENTSKVGTYYYYVIATNTITDTKGETVTSNAVSNVAKLVCHNRITVSTVGSNDVVMTPAYWDKYAVGYKTTDSVDGYIGNVASCYGSYGNNTVEKAFDGNWNTFWETNRGGVNNYLEFTFVDSVKVDRILYATRQDGYKGRGYPTILTIYMAEDEQNYVEVGVAKSSENSGYVYIT